MAHIGAYFGPPSVTANQQALTNSGGILRYQLDDLEALTATSTCVIQSESFSVDPTNH